MAGSSSLGSRRNDAADAAARQPRGEALAALQHGVRRVGACYTVTISTRSARSEERRASPKARARRAAVPSHAMRRERGRSALDRRHDEHRPPAFGQSWPADRLFWASARPGSGCPITAEIERAREGRDLIAPGSCRRRAVSASKQSTPAAVAAAAKASRPL